MFWQLHRRLHVSWHITGFSIGILLGVALIVIMPQYWFYHAVWLLLGLSCLGLAMLRPKRYTVVVALCGGMLVGLWCGSMERQAFNYYQQYLQKSIILQGELVEDASKKVHKEQTAYLQHIVIQHKSLRGRIWVSIVDSALLKRGDKVLLKGKLSSGFGATPASMFRAELLRVERLGSLILDVRDTFAAGVKAYIPEPQASLGLGFLLGQQGDLPQEIDQQLKAVGLTHIVVASGYNVTIIVLFARRLLERFSRYMATATASLLIIGFIMIAGFSASMVRAGLVAGLSLLAWYYGRKIHPIVLISFVAALTVVSDPSHIWGDVSWYLSFLAFSGVLLVAPLLQAFFWPNTQKLGIFTSILVSTLSAIGMTLPLLLGVFGKLSAFAVAANILVLPLLPITMLCTFIAGIASIWLPMTAHLVSLPATLLLQLITSIAAWIASWPGAEQDIELPPGAMIVCYVVIFTVSIWLKYKTQLCYTKQKQTEILF